MRMVLISGLDHWDKVQMSRIVKEMVKDNYGSGISKLG